MCGSRNALPAILFRKQSGSLDLRTFRYTLPGSQITSIPQFFVCFFEAEASHGKQAHAISVYNPTDIILTVALRLSQKSSADNLLSMRQSKRVHDNASPDNSIEIKVPQPSSGSP